MNGDTEESAADVMAIIESPTHDVPDEYDLVLLQRFNNFESLTQLQAVGPKMEGQCLRFQNEKGESFFIKKTTLCWLLNNKAPEEKLSTDRIRRFIMQRDRLESAPDSQKCEVLKIGDWCEFDGQVGTVGQVIGFSYLSGTKKDRVYTLDSVPLQFDEENGNAKGVGVLCNWFTIVPGYVLEIANTVHQYIDVKKYKNHIKKPSINDVMQLILNSHDHVMYDDIQ